MKTPGTSKYTIEDFTHTIPIKSIEEKMGKREFKKFMKFMNGQTVGVLEAQSGIYRWDLERFLNGDFGLWD